MLLLEEINSYRVIFANIRSLMNLFVPHIHSFYIGDF
jgi:hypothetical protein